MASNSFGRFFRITTFGESHGKGIGVVIDGCPSQIPLTVEMIQERLIHRRPKSNGYTTERREEDLVEILSGLFEGKTTGAPIALFIHNQDAHSHQYESIKHLYRPGHANFTYLAKYGIFDYRGGGRSSGRETLARVAAGAVAKELLNGYKIDCIAFLSELGGIKIPPPDLSNLEVFRKQVYEDPIFCPCKTSSLQMQKKILEVKEDFDSIGGIVSCVATVPIGLGDPVYAKLEALLAFAMLSIPATKGFEIGAGFQVSSMRGSSHNDLFDIDEDNQVYTTTNFCGGTLGGISTGAPLFFRVAFKPTSSIKRKQRTVSLDLNQETMELPIDARHDPCVAIRGVPVVEAMCALVLADSVLSYKAHLNPSGIHSTWQGIS